MLKVELPDAQAVQPGQGQTVRVAGVEIGQIGKVELEDGKAVVELQLEPKYEGLIKDDATALLRAEDRLKDMFLEVDPGDGKPLEDGGRIQVAEHRAGHRPGRVPLGARRRHARLPQAPDLRRRQGPRRPRQRPARGASRGSARSTATSARVSRAVARAAQQPRAAREQLRPADDRAGQQATRTSCGSCAASNAVLGAFADEDAELSGARRAAAGHAAARPRPRSAKVDRLSDAAAARARGAAPAVPPARRGQRRACCRSSQEAHADRARRDPPVRARRAARSSRDLGTAVRGPRAGDAGPHDVASTSSTASSTSAPSTRGREGISDCETTAPARRGARARRGLPLLARLGRAEHRLAVQHGRRAGPVPARVFGGVSCGTCERARPDGVAGAGRRPAAATPRGRPLPGAGGVRAQWSSRHPSIGRIVAMVGFTLSCFGVLLFLWLAFGGSVPLKPEGYRFKVAVPGGGDARRGGRRADRRRERGQGQDEGARRGRQRARSSSSRSTSSTRRSRRTRARSCARRRCSARPTWSSRPGQGRAGMLDDGGRLPNAQRRADGRAGRDLQRLRQADRATRSRTGCSELDGGDRRRATAART